MKISMLVFMGGTGPSTGWGVFSTGLRKGKMRLLPSTVASRMVMPPVPYTHCIQRLLVFCALSCTAQKATVKTIHAFFIAHCFVCKGRPACYSGGAAV